MKRILSLVMLLGLSVSALSQGITVTPHPTNNPTATTQLVTNYLVNSQDACLAQVSNVTKSTGTNYGYSQGNGIGTFSYSGSSFPMTGGLVLTSGNAVAAQGPNTNTSSFSSPAWVGDPAINAILGINSKNATVLEFDFIPATANFSATYIFASEEYGQYQCESNDGFIMLLTNVTGGGAPVNIATLPTSQPVSINTVKDITYNSGCASVNPQYFGAFYGGGNGATAPINYEGRTVMLTSTATLTPGNTYHLKIVVADDGGADSTDGEYDSAVFFPQGMMNLGQDLLPLDLTTSNASALCTGDSFTIDTGLSSTASQYNISWTRNGNPISGGAVLTDNLPGNYAVTVTRISDNCSSTQSIVIEYSPAINPNQPNNLYACENGSGNYTYNLALNTPVVKQGLDPATIVSYHASQNDAENNLSPLGNSYNSPGGQTVWVRVKRHNSACYAVLSFQLLTLPAPSATQPSNLTQCEDAEGSGQAMFNLTSQNAIILGSQPVNENTILFFTSLAGAQDGSTPINTPESYTGNSQTIYVRVQRNFDTSCYTTTSFNLEVVPLPTIAQPDDVTACNSYELPALSVGNYYTGTGGTGTMMNAGDFVTSSQTVYIYATNTQGTSTCANQVSFEVNIVTAASAPNNVSACGSYTLPALPSGQFYYNGPGGTSGQIPVGTVINSTQTIYFYIPSAAECTQDTNFVVTIHVPPTVNDPANVDVCGPYVLPALPSGQFYYTGTGATGTQLTAGSSVDSSQTIYVFGPSPTNTNCYSEENFTVTINNINVDDVADVTRCGNYTLPALPAGQNYYTGSGATGTQLAAGTIITTSQTIYIYGVSPTNPACNDEENFVVTINAQPVLNPIANVTACGSYTLPSTLPSYANYYTGSNGSGTLLPAGTVLTTSQTVYAYATSANGCVRQRSFTVTIIDINAITPGNQDVCGSYQLPALAVGGYYSGPGGTGTQFNPGANITSTQTIYVYVQSNTTPVCTAESSFVVTVYPLPNIAPTPQVIACNSYTLPSLSVGNYFTGLNGTGTQLPAGTVINTTTNLYVYAESGGTPNCTRQRGLVIKIINGSINPADVSSCGPYVLPALPLGNYYTAPSGGGTQIPAGTAISSTQTIYTWVATTTGTNCTDNNSFTVTIAPDAEADDPGDVVSCVEYQLPALTNGNYFTGQGGTGTQLNAGDIITTNTTLYIYYNNPAIPACTDENSFTITINDFQLEQPEDQLVCDGYVLPELEIGNYYTGPGATGTQLNAGDIVDTDQTIYIYATTNTTPVCTDEVSFDVEIKPNPAIDTPGNVGSCGTYTLPALTVGSYYTAPGGTGTQLTAGQVISVTTEIYIYAETGGSPNCAAEHMFTVYINPQPPVDVTICGSYTLPVLPVGEYRTGPAGTGTVLAAGDVITSSQQIYVYIPMTTVPNCTDNNFFTVTINPYPILDPVPVLSPMCDQYILPELTVGNYYTEPDGQGDLLLAGDYITATQTIYVYAESGTTPNCTVQDSFDVVIYDTPTVDARSLVERCDQYELTPLVVGAYYGLPGGPNVPGQVEYFAGDIITDSMTMYIYGESGTTPNCFQENSFDIDIYTITADNPSPVYACDSYELPALETGDYYALSGGPDTPGQILIEAGDVLTASQTLYVYAELGGRVNCNDENVFEVTIFQTPQVPTTQPDIEECFEYTLPAIGGPGNYYTDENGTGTMLNAGDVITSSQTIYIYAASGDTNVTCFTQHEFDVIINTIYVPEVADFYACESYTLPALSVGNYYTGPNASGTMLPAGTVITTTSTIYIYAQTDTVPMCTAESDFTVTVVYPPTFTQPAPLAVCAIDDEGHGIFNLVPAMQTTLGNQPNVSMSIHETMEDAMFNNDPVTNPGAYANINAFTQTLYIRLQNNLASTCYTIVELQLIVNPRPQAATPADYELCDDGNNDTDGIAVFDLTTVETTVLNGMNPAQFSVTYYTSLASAELGVTPISNPSSYPSQTDTIYVRVTNNTTGCYDIVELEIIVNPLPVVNDPAPYSLCDEVTVNDEQEVFDLTTKYEEIVDDLNGIVFTIHDTYAEAESGINAIPNPEAYTNNATVETLFVRVTIEATGCYRIVLLDVRVEPLPVLYIPNIDEELTTVCDEDGDGIGVFNLQEMIDDMLDGGVNIQVTFHETATDAHNGLNAIPNLTNYQNAIPLLDHIYVRAENTVTGCVSSVVYELELTVVPSPQVPELADITICDDQDNNGSDNHAYFDITVRTPDIEAVLGSGYIIHYFISENNARNGAPRIVNPANYYGAHQQTIWVRVEDPDTGCFGIESFQLFLNQPLALTTPSMLSICDNLDPINDGKATFDLTTKDEEILGPFGVGQGYTVEYFVLAADRDAGVNPIANPEAYENVLNAQTLYVLVTSEEGCISKTTLTIRVLPIPTPNENPDALILCDDNNSPDGVEEFNLFDAEAQIRNNDSTTVISYHVTWEDADQDINPIADPSQYESATGTVYVRVEANTGVAGDEVCYVIVELDLIVNPLPELGVNGVIPPNAFCEVNTDGFHTFTLNDHIPFILAEGLDPADYRIRFYADPNNLTQALPNIYTNQVQGHEVIYVWVQNRDTECTIIAPVDLYVEEAAIAYPVTDQSYFQQCDYDGTNDGMFLFDLTTVESTVLGTQDPLVYSVLYYETIEDAVAETNAIQDPTAYTNSIAGDQTIYIRVTNTSTISRCYEITTIDIHVEEIPEPTLTGGTICVDYTTGEVLTPYLLDTGMDDTYTYIWSLNGVVIPGADGPTYLATEAGSYTVDVQSPSALGCISDPLAPVTVEQSGPASVIDEGFSVTNAFSDEQTITIHVRGYGDYEFQLENGPWQDSNVFYNVIPRATPYTVHVRDKNACIDYVVDIPNVSVIDYPRYFTPNGDGYNDTWNIYGLMSQGDAKIYIFDRYGKLIKQISSESAGWNGRYGGQEMPADDYWFTVTYRELVITKPAVVDPITGDETTPPVRDWQTREFKSHFALKR